MQFTETDALRKEAALLNGISKNSKIKACDRGKSKELRITNYEKPNN
jgi:hypothetical protein